MDQEEASGTFQAQGVSEEWKSRNKKSECDSEGPLCRKLKQKGFEEHLSLS